MTVTGKVSDLKPMFHDAALQILTDVLGVGNVSMMALYDFITDQAVQKKFLEKAESTKS